MSENESLEKLLQILDSANAKGILSMLEYLVNDADELVDAGIEAISTPHAFEWMSSAGVLLESTKQIDVQSLPAAAKGLNAFVEGFVHTDDSIRVHNVFDLLALLKDPDIRIALAAIFRGLKGMGKALQND